MSTPQTHSTNMISSPVYSLKRLGFVLALALAALAPAVQAQEGTHYTSQRAADEFGKLPPLIEAKNWDGAIRLIEGILSWAKPGSYDQAYSYDILSRLYLQQSEYAKAIPAYQQALQLGDAYKYFDERSQLERIYYLAQLYYQEAGTTKVKAVQEQDLAKATDYLGMWFKRTKKPTEEARTLYATLLFQRAILDPNHINKDLLAQARVQAQEGLLDAIHPKENLYIILLATYQQEEDNVKAAELLELLVKRFPSKKTYWQQLWGTYTNLAATTKDPDKVEEYNIRSILTIERAQALGFLNSPKENFNLFGIYYNMGQFGEATRLLYKGLKDGKIESDVEKWQLLANSYQQINKEFMAIQVLKEAAQRFPKAGQLEFQLAQILYSLDKVHDAYDHLNLALAKDNLQKPGSVYYFKAYVCYELLKYEEALVAINKAATYPDARDAQLPQLRQAIESAIKDREAAKAQAENQTS